MRHFQPPKPRPVVRVTRATAGHAKAKGAAMTSLTIHVGTNPVGYVIAPTGSDSTGTGSEANPWRTLSKFYSVATPGDTLNCRGGTYAHPGVLDVTNVATVGSPITVRNFPDETPLFTCSEMILAFNSGAAHHVIDGLRFSATPPNGGGGVLWVGNGRATYDGPPRTGPVKFRNCVITKAAGAGTSPHGLYVSWGATDVTVEYSTFHGLYSSEGNDGSTAVHINHAPEALNTVVDHCIIENWSNGVIMWNEFDPVILTATITHNTFVGNATAIDARYHSTILVRDNAGGTNDYNLYDPNDSADTTQDHNYWGQTFDANYYLVAGQTGRGAASDGTDAGALDW